MTPFERALVGELEGSHGDRVHVGDVHGATALHHYAGLNCGVLIRRLGFGWGNLVQALIFLVPHLALLLIDVRLWPVIPVQFAAGWLLGCLRHKSDSFVPGAAVHIVANIAAGLIAA